MTIGSFTAVTSIVLGILVGLVAGYYGGKVDEALMRITDMWLSVTTLLFAVLLAAVLI